MIVVKKKQQQTISQVITDFSLGKQTIGQVISDFKTPLDVSNIYPP